MTVKNKTYKIEINNQLKIISENNIELKKIKKVLLKENGDFRSNECKKILNEADIIVTNPPYSLFRDFIDLLISSNKNFLIIGNSNAITYQNCFKYIKENKMWLGINCVRWFLTPKNELFEAARSFWFTNLETEKRKEKIKLIQKYDKNIFPSYDNYNAIEVSKTKNIPYDYKGIMGVPITFLDKYNPEQFEIIGSDFEVKKEKYSFLIRKNWKGKVDRGYLNGKRLYSRILIRNKML